MPDPAEEADLNAIKQWLYGWLVPVDPAIIATQARSAAQWMQSLRADGSWGDIDYADQTPGPWKTSEHLNRLLVLAKAYSTPSQKLYRDSGLLARILAAFDFWLAHDFQNPNWWHNRIGVPMLISYTMILIEARLSPQQIQRGCAILRRSTFEGAAGANLTWLANNQLICGCLDRTSALVGTALGRAFDEIRIVEPGQEGIQADLSFHQHEAVLYSGGYGLALTSDAARFVACAHGTRFAAPTERFDLLMRFLLDGQQWMMRGIMFDYSTVGREITRPGKDGRAILRAVSDLARLAGPRQAELVAFAARMAGDPGAPSLAGNRHFRLSDYMIHQRRGYAMSVRMYSKRTFNTDGYINDEGRQTHHVADGATYIFRTGEEYRDIFPVWDWRRVPGITCEQHPQPLDPARLHTRGATGFAGGVSDGMYGVAAMDLRREELSARKAWFFFEQ
jgi:chondroitin AC lyase